MVQSDCDHLHCISIVNYQLLGLYIYLYKEKDKCTVEIFSLILDLWRLYHQDIIFGNE